MRVCSDGRVSDVIDSRAVSESDPAALRAVAVTVALEAAAHVRRRRAELFGSARPLGGEGNAVQTKSTDTDPVTIADTESEDLIRSRLGQLRLATDSSARRAEAATAQVRAAWGRPESSGSSIPSTAR